MSQEAGAGGAAGAAAVRGERRIAASIAVVVSMAIPLLLPKHLSPGPVWILSVVEGLFLVLIAVADPGLIDKRTPFVRSLSIGLVVVIAGGAAAGTARLVWELLHGAPATKDAGELLYAGSLVWIDTVIAFAFVFWQLDGGGPAARFAAPPEHPDFAFPQHMSPELAPPGWGPVFFDYLYLGLTNAIAFSPTDTMPLSRWAKATMAVQSLISVVILSLVVANSVNLLGS